MLRKPITLFTSALTLGCSALTGSGDDEVGGEDLPADGFVNAAATWQHPRALAYGTAEHPLGEFETDLQGVPIDTTQEQPEWVPYAWSVLPTQSRPPIPYPRGISKAPVDIPTLADRGNSHYYLTKGHGLDSLGIGAATPRSGYVTNYAVPLHLTDEASVYLPAPLQLDHPRLPFLTLLVSVNPLDWGRYNAAGVGCTPWEWDIPSTPWYAVSWGTPRRHDVLEATDWCSEWIHSVGINPLSADHPFADGVDIDAHVDAAENAVCLTNGGEHDLVSAFLAVGEKNDGTVFFNMREFVENQQDIYEWAGVSEELWDNVIVWMDRALELGLVEGKTWAHFSDTGMCGFGWAAQVIGVNSFTEDVLWETTRGCPKDHYAVIPMFSELGVQLGDTIDGYCALGFGGSPMTTAPWLVYPPETFNDVPSGILAYTLNLDLLTVETILGWAGVISTTETPEGLVLHAVPDPTSGSTRAGDDVLALFGLEDGDVITGIGHDLDLSSPADHLGMLDELCEHDDACPILCGGEVDCDPLSWGAAELAYRKIDSDLARRGYTEAIFVRRGHEVRPTYLRAYRDR